VVGGMAEAVVILLITKNADENKVLQIPLSKAFRDLWIVSRSSFLINSNLHKIINL
jgi:hypothetical protein